MDFDKLGRKLAEQATFSKLLYKENLSIGLHIWVRTLLPLLIFYIVLWVLLYKNPNQLKIVLILSPFTIAIYFYLLQRVAGKVAKSRFGLTIIGLCWWSIAWRLMMYWALLELPFLLWSLVEKRFINLREVNYYMPEGILYAATLVFVLFIFAHIVFLGAATSRAFYYSLKKTVNISTTWEDVAALSEKLRQQRMAESINKGDG